MPVNDNDPAGGVPVPASDAHGSAALVLIESLIHGLCEKAALRTDEAVAIIERAASVQFDHAEELDGDAARMRRSHGLLVAMADSLRIDGTPEPAHPA